MTRPREIDCLRTNHAPIWLILIYDSRNYICPGRAVMSGTFSSCNERLPSDVPLRPGMNLPPGRETVMYRQLSVGDCLSVEVTAPVEIRPRRAATERRPSPRTARVTFIYFAILAPAIETGSPILTNSRASCVPGSIVV